MDALIVDDDDLMADLLETVVAGLHSAVTVFKAAGFHEALTLWQKRKPDLLIVDWDLPDGSGLDFLRQVRASDKDVAIVMITGRADRESILKAAHYRINGYISKPFQVDVLHQRLLEMIGKLLPEELAPAASLEVLLSEGVKTVIQLPVSADVAACWSWWGAATIYRRPSSPSAGRVIPPYARACWTLLTARHTDALDSRWSPCGTR